MTSTYPGRKTVYLPETFQGKFAARLALYWTLYHVAMWHCLFFMDYVTSRAMLGGPGASISFGEQYLGFARRNWPLAMWAIVIGPVVVWQFVCLSHRVAGPLVRLEQTLNRMAKGDRVEKIRFRDGDLAAGVEKAFNAYLASLEARPAADADSVRATRRPSNRMVESADAQAIERTLQEIGKTLESIHAEC